MKFPKELNKMLTPRSVQQTRSPRLVIAKISFSGHSSRSMLIHGRFSMENFNRTGNFKSKFSWAVWTRSFP